MISQSITIINKLGLHARAAAKLVRTASSYHADIHVEKNGHRVNAKSIMGVMMLAASQGTELLLLIDGRDEEPAKNAIMELINNYFGEGE